MKNQRLKRFLPLLIVLIISVLVGFASFINQSKEEFEKCITPGMRARFITNKLEKEYLYREAMIDYKTNKAWLLSKKNLSDEDITEFLLKTIPYEMDKYTCYMFNDDENNYYEDYLEESEDAVITKNNEVDGDISSSANASGRVVYKKVNDDTGYIMFNSFYGSVNESIREATDSMGKTQSLIIDLRFNTGGEIHRMFNLVDNFLKPGIEVYREDYIYDGKKDYVIEKTRQKQEYNYKNIFIIVSGDTASAAEVFTVVLKENYDGNVYILGTDKQGTFGKNTTYLQHMRKNFVFTCTYSKWRGNNDSAPVIPDYIINNNDLQVVDNVPEAIKNAFMNPVISKRERAHFIETAIGSYKSNTNYIKKWTKEINIEINNDYTESDYNTITDTIELFRTIPGIPDINIVEENGNVKMHFISREKFTDYLEDYNTGSPGYCTCWHLKGEMIKGIVLIDSENKSEKSRDLIIMQQLTNILGLMDHSETFENSILVDFSNYEPDKIQSIDIKAISLLYSAEIKPLMKKVEVLEVIEKVFSPE
jgi:hypothetical protein